MYLLFYPSIYSLSTVSVYVICLIYLSYLSNQISHVCISPDQDAYYHVFAVQVLGVSIWPST